MFACLSIQKGLPAVSPNCLESRTSVISPCGLIFRMPSLDHVHIAVFAYNQIVQMYPTEYCRQGSVTLQSPNAVVIRVGEINASLSIEVNSGSYVSLGLTP